MQPDANPEPQPFNEYAEDPRSLVTPTPVTQPTPVGSNNPGGDLDDPVAKKLINSIRTYAVFCIVVSCIAAGIFIVNNSHVFSINIPLEKLDPISILSLLTSLPFMFFPVFAPALLIIGCIGLLLLKRWGKGFLLAGLIVILAVSAIYIFNPMGIAILLGSIISSIFGALTAIAILIILIGGFKIIKNKDLNALLKTKRP